MKRYTTILVLLCAVFVAAEPMKVKESLQDKRAKVKKVAVTLAWAPSPSEHVVAYTLTWGLEQYPTNTVTVTNTTCTTTISNLQPNTVYVFWVRSVDLFGQESKPSNEVRYRTQSR